MRGPRRLAVGAALALTGACAGAPPAQILTAPSAAPSAARELVLYRDEYGVPHIYADDTYGLFFGYGYAVAQDRLFQMEMGRRSTQGRVAEVLGADYVDFDSGIRRGFDPASIRRQIEALGADDRAVFDGYAAGMNAWLARIRAAPENLLPQEFTEFGFEPGDWTAFDVVMMFVGTLANRYADFNTELENAQLLATLSERHGVDAATAIFDQMNPRTSDVAPTTIPPADWPGGAGVAAAVTRAAGNVPAVAGRLPATPATSGASNCYVLGRARVSGASAILVNGPQFGWYAPAYVYSVGLHGAGFDVVGNTPFALPVLLFAHNGEIAWGSTWGAGDLVDVYAERLHPDDADRYWYRGGWRAFEIREELLPVRGAEPVRLTIRRSVHGQVVHEDLRSGWAYAKRRGWDGREVDSLLGWLHSMRARDYEQWIAQAARNALNINWYYADRRGNIGYAFTGAYPHRHPSHDNRLPVNGEGEFDWRGMQDFSRNPQVLNPTGGVIANWNNKPAEGVLNPDMFWYSWGEADRVDVLHHALSARERFSADEAWALIEWSSYADVNAPYFLPLLQRVGVEEATALRALDLLDAWNMQSRDEDRDGFYDEPATAVFRTFLAVLIEDVLADDLGDAFGMFAATGYPTPGSPTGAGLNLQTGTKAIVSTLTEPHPRYDLLNGEFPEAQLEASFLRATAQLQTAQGDDPARWRLPAPPRPYLTRNFLQIPQAGEKTQVSGRIEQNRGTENNMMVLGPSGIVGWEVTPPGQSGFIAPDGTRAAHSLDQLAMFDEFGRRRTHFTREEVEAHAASVHRIAY